MPLQQIERLDIVHWFIAQHQQEALHPQVLDYDNTATTLLPLVATSYVLHAAGKAVWGAYEFYESEKRHGRFSTLPELHASASGLKALCTEFAADGIEAARRACGGHGYSVLSGLPTLYASYVQNVTWEGDNNVLLLQVWFPLCTVYCLASFLWSVLKLRACLFFVGNLYDKDTAYQALRPG
jgi:alkylation response protein AidB-like acyl-CoA dehydrogenase